MIAVVTDVRYRMAPTLIRELGQAGVEVIACQRQGEAEGPAVGSMSRWCGAFYPLPAENYARALWGLLRDVGREYGCRPAVLPVGAHTLSMLARYRARFEQVGGLCIPTTEQLELLNSKQVPGELAEELDIPVPTSFFRRAGESAEQFTSRLPLPCVIKPDWGEGLGLRAGDRYVIAGTAAEALAAYDRFLALSEEEPLVQEYLSGGGLGCSVLAERGRVMASLCHRRVREYPASGGPSSCCESVFRPELEDYAARIVERTGYTGLAMFEFKEDAGGWPRLLEANPRVWGTFPLTRAAGTGMAGLWCALAWNSGNPDQAVPLPDSPAPRPVRMQFAVSDLAAVPGYIRAGEPQAALRALWDLIDPRVRGGLFEWRDPRPAIEYGKQCLRRRRGG